MASPLPIDPTKPVAGNLTGTFAGFIAMLVAGYVGKLGLYEVVSHFLSSDPAMCTQLEGGLFVFTIAAVGSVVNYAVTHFSQVKKLKELYDAIPTVEASYPEAKGQNPKQR